MATLTPTTKYTSTPTPTNAIYTPSTEPARTTNLTATSVADPKTGTVTPLTPTTKTAAVAPTTTAKPAVATPTATNTNNALTSLISGGGLVRQGSTGDAVTQLQKTLTAAGYDTKGVDGVFGNNTLSALQAYQKANGLTVDGIAGKQTLSALNAPTQASGSTTPLTATAAASKSATPSASQTQYGTNVADTVSTAVPNAINPENQTYNFEPIKSPSPQEYTKSVGQSALSVQNVADQVGSVINQYKGASAEEQAVIAAQLTRMNTAINDLEAKMTTAIQSAMGGDDPAMTQAFAVLKDQFTNDQQSVMSELNSKGILQSGVYAKALTDLEKGYLSQKQQIIADRFGDLQNQLLQNMMTIGQLRLGALQDNNSAANTALSNANQNVASMGMQGVQNQMTQGAQVDQNNQYYTGLNAQMQYNYDKMNSENQLAYDQLNTQTGLGYDQLNSQNRNTTAQIYNDYIQNVINNNTARRGQDVGLFSDKLNYSNQYQMNSEDNANALQMNQNDNATSRANAITSANASVSAARASNPTGITPELMLRYGLQPDPNSPTGYSTQEMRNAQANIEANKDARTSAEFTEATTSMLPYLMGKVGKNGYTTQNALEEINKMPYTDNVKAYLRSAINPTVQTQTSSTPTVNVTPTVNNPDNTDYWGKLTSLGEYFKPSNNFEVLHNYTP